MKEAEGSFPLLFFDLCDVISRFIPKSIARGNLGYLA